VTPREQVTFLAQARRFLEDAQRDSTHLESAVVLYWNACISAMDAILTAVGLRVGSGEDSHAVRVNAAAEVLGAGYAELFERLDEWRRERHDVSYAALTPSAGAADAMRGDARDIVAAAATLLGRRG
jgi:hypothetical protein